MNCILDQYIILGVNWLYNAGTTDGYWTNRIVFCFFLAQKKYFTRYTCWLFYCYFSNPINIICAVEIEHNNNNVTIIIKLLLTRLMWLYDDYCHRRYCNEIGVRRKCELIYIIYIYIIYVCIMYKTTPRINNTVVRYLRPAL